MDNEFENVVFNNINIESFTIFQRNNFKNVKMYRCEIFQKDYLQTLVKNNFVDTDFETNKLVYYKQFQMIGDVIGREKQLKAGSRASKTKLIEGMNPFWNDLYKDIRDIMTL